MLHIVRMLLAFVYGLKESLFSVVDVNKEHILHFQSMEHLLVIHLWGYIMAIWPHNPNLYQVS